MSDRGGRGGRGGRGSGGDRGGRGNYRGDGGGRGGGGRGGGGGGRGSGEFRGRNDFQGGRGRGRGDRGGPGGGGNFRGGPPRGVDPADMQLFRQQGGPTRPDDGVTQGENSLVRSFEGLSLSSLPAHEFPARPGFGTAGTPTTVYANHFPIKVDPSLEIFEYRIAIEPKPRTKLFQKRVVVLLLKGILKDHSMLATDYASVIYSPKELPTKDLGIGVKEQKPTKHTIKFYFEDEEGPPQNAKEFQISLTFQRSFTVEQALSFARGESKHKTQQIDTTIAYDTLQAMNIILSQFPLNYPGAAPVGRNKYFDYGHDVASIGGALNAVRGYYSSVRAGHGRLLANINVCTTAFYQETDVARAMCDFLNINPGNVNASHVISQADRLKSFFKGVKVRRIYLKNPRAKTIFTFGSSRSRVNTPRNTFFECEDFGKKEKISVEEYFKRKYSINLTYPQLPCVNIGTRENPVEVPPEQLFIIAGQPFKGHLSESNTAEIIKFAARKPTNNARLITTKGMEVLGHTQSSVNIAAKFGISVDQHMVLINARVLMAPKPQYYQKKAISPRNASWNMSNIKFSQPAKVGKIEYLYIANRFSRQDDFPRTRVGFEKELRNCGLSYSGEYVETPLFLNHPGDLKPLRDRFDALGKMNKMQKPALLVALVPDKNKLVYGTVKKGGDIMAGVPTICMVMENVTKQFSKGMEAQYFANVCLKANLKLGGKNHVLDGSQLGRLIRDPSAPIMLMGADVTHPSPGSLKGTPSIAAVVASVDASYSQFPASMRLQKSKQEMIDNLDAMVKERLEEYYRKNNRKLPPAILYYRDGVSEGQYNQVLDIEVPQIRKGCTAMDPKWNPKFTVIIVGKRHHTRFYPAQENGADRNFNCVPGTVVDRAVTHVYDFDFFLQAHAGLQGTTKPAHYYVIKDENKFGADEIQQLTHNLCYLYGRATKGVSIVPPAYYADLACERGRFYIHGLLTGTDAQSVSSGGSEDEEKVRERAKVLWGAGIHRDIVSTMFYI